MEHDHITFTVDPLWGANRFRVSWETETQHFWFVAIIEQDQITKVLGSMGSRPPGPVVVSQAKTPAASTRYHAAAPEFSGIILAATRHIRSEKLASYAIEQRDKRRAEQEQARIKEMADRMRKALNQVGEEYDAIAEALGLPHMRQEHREGISEVMSLDDATLYRLAAILGID